MAVPRWVMTIYPGRMSIGNTLGRRELRVRKGLVKEGGRDVVQERVHECCEM